ncbi:MAG: PAS domain S-box protein [Chlorobiales bacterium]|nr:PAS domain S-box protein [Chlorobiales bacterium]
MPDTHDITHLLNTIKELQERVTLLEKTLQEQTATDRQHTEVAFHHSDEMNCSLFKNMLNGFAHCRMLYKDGKPDDFIYLSVNDAVKTLIGLKEIVGKKVTELVPGVKETDPELLDIFGRVAMTGQTERFEKYVEALQQWFSVSVYSPEKDHFAVVYDVITERKRAEEELAKQKCAEQFHTLIESTPDAIIVLTGEYISYVNRAALHLCGADSADQVIGLSFIDRVHPSMRSVIQSIIHRVADEQQRVSPLEHIGIRLDGTEVPIEISAVPIAYEGKNGVMIFIKDITERKWNEKALQESEAMYRSILKASPDSNTITDLEGHIRMVSHAALKIFGHTQEEEVLGHSIFEHTAPEDLEQLRTDIAHVYQGVFTGPREYHGLRVDGSVFVIESNAEVIRDTAGAPTGIVIITRDISERKRAEVALRDSEALYRSILKASPDSITIIGLDGRIRMASPSALKMFGHTQEEEALGRSILEYVTPEFREQVQSQILLVYQGSFTGPNEYRAIRTDGSVIDVEANGEVIRDAAGAPTGIVIITRDISERKSVEDALRESEQNYREIFNATSEAIFLHDAVTGRMLDANDATVKMYGYDSKAEVQRRNIGDLSSNEQPYTLAEAVRCIRLAVEECPQVFEWHARKKNGDLFWVEVSLRSTQIGGKGRILAVVRDISERKRAEKALRESERNYREIFNATNEAIFLHDAVTGSVLDVNDTSMRLFGYELKEEILTARPGELSLSKPPYTGEERLHRIQMAVEHGPQIFEWHARKKNGDLFWVEVSLHSTQIGGKGRVLAVIHDITERKRAEEEKEKLQIELAHAQKMESIGRLAGGVAHDFNNMLSVIIGYSELAMLNMNPSEPLYTNLNEILSTAKRSAEVTRKLLTFARKQLISPRSINLNETVAITFKTLRRLIGENIDLAWQQDEKLWSVKMDPVQVDQILVNLCLNSRDAIEGVGKISIKTDNMIIDQAFCDTHEGSVPGEFVVLTVSDDGTGMDKETLEHIFEPFFTTKEFGQGTGMGMATVYGIVKQNNGFIDVFSEPGKGTTVTVFLPRNESLTAKTRTEDTKKISVSQGETVLIVEDEESILKTLKIMLKQLGYTTLSANLPSKALCLVKEYHSKIDLLITDVIMPEMNGRELADQLHAAYPDMKIMFMSGYTADTIANWGILQEDVHFLQKPFTMKDLACKIREVLEAT